MDLTAAAEEAEGFLVYPGLCIPVYALLLALFWEARARDGNPSKSLPYLLLPCFGQSSAFLGQDISKWCLRAW